MAFKRANWTSLLILLIRIFIFKENSLFSNSSRLLKSCYKQIRQNIIESNHNQIKLLLQIKCWYNKRMINSLFLMMLMKVKIKQRPKQLKTTKKHLKKSMASYQALVKESAVF